MALQRPPLVLIIGSLMLSVSCAAQPGPAPSPTPSPQSSAQGATRGTSVRIVSVVGEPGGRGGAWNLAPDQDMFQLRITLEGTGVADIRAELFTSDGRSVRRVDRTIDLDGAEEIDLSDFAVPEPGGYRLEVEVTAPGVRSSQSVTIRRG